MIVTTSETVAGHRITKTSPEQTIESLVATACAYYAEGADA